jgi:hypothetical protein
MSPEEKAALKAELNEVAQQSLGSCCTMFFGAGFTALAVGKFAGATYSSLWIIFPVLLFCGIVLCCFAYCIFGANDAIYQESLNQTNGGGGAGAPSPMQQDGPPAPAPAEEAPNLLPPFSEADLTPLGVKQLKALARVNGVDTSDCFEKSEVVAKLVAGPPAPAPAPAPVPAPAPPPSEVDDVEIRVTDSDDLD